MTRCRVLLLALTACNGLDAGGVRVRFAWADGQGPSAERELWLETRVEERTGDTLLPGRVLGASERIAYRAGESPRVELPGVPVGDRRVVVAEMREADLDGAQVVFYGVSEAFTLRAGQTQDVEVRLQLGPPPGIGPAGERAGGVYGVGPALGFARVNGTVVDLVVWAEAGPAVVAELSNSPAFEVVAAYALNDLQISSDPSVPSGAVGLDVIAWNLDDGVSGLCDGTGGVPCERLVYARFSDVAGYTSPTYAGRVALDTEAPRAEPPRPEDTRYLPGVGNPLASVSAARIGTSVEVVFLLNERVVETTLEVRLGDPFSAQDPNNVFACVSGTLSHRCTLDIGTWNAPANFGPAPVEVFLDHATDEAGNSLAQSLSVGSFRLKTTTPELDVHQDGVVFVRSPWGNAAWEDLEGSAVPGGCAFQVSDPPDRACIPPGRYFALAPGDGLSLQRALPADVFSLLDGEPLSLVRVWGQDGSTLLGTLAPNGDGSWPRQKLNDVDTSFVLLTGVDEAGNESALVPLDRVELVVTANPPLFGESPHALEMITNAEDRAGPDPEVTTMAGAAGTGADGLALLATAAATWRHKGLSQGGPSARGGCDLAFDSARGRMVLFGGGFSQASARNDVWEWDGARWWGPFSPANRPSTRMGQALAYDAGRGRVVLFGGSDGDGARDDLWEWDGQVWTRVVVSSPWPIAREAHALAYDAGRGRVVMFGGRLLDSVVATDELWEWDGQRWWGPMGPALPPDPDAWPSAREMHALTYDSVRGAVVLFGGVTSNADRDVWEWNGAAWTRHSPGDPRPSERYFHELAFDRGRGRVVLSGGLNAALAVIEDDVWEWDGSAWHGPLLPNPRPGRWGHGLTYDHLHGRVVLFGGSGVGVTFDDLWEWDGMTWLGPYQPGAAPAPSRRSELAMAYDSVRGRVVLFGGYVEGSPWSSAETWEWDGLAWHGPLVSASGPPPSARSESAMAYDRTRERVVLFGGNDGAVRDDAWEWDGSSWYGPFTQALGPSPRERHALAYDSERGVVVLFGGLGSAGPLDDVWEWTSPLWAGPFASGSGPGARVDHALAYDGARQRVVLHGGFDLVARDDVWEWDGASWSGPFVTPSAPVLSNHAMAYDEARARTVVFSGQSDVAGTRWEWDGEAWWGPFLPAMRPNPRTGHALVFDSARDRMVLFGGQDQYELLGDVWELEASSDRQPAVQFTLDLGSAATPRAAVTGLRVRADCGGRTPPFGTQQLGAELWGWSNGAPPDPINPGVFGGTWVPLGANAVGLGGVPLQLPAPPGARISWATASPEEARRYIREIVRPFASVERSLAFQCRPIGGSGVLGAEAEVGLDYIEVRVTYEP